MGGLQGFSAERLRRVDRFLQERYIAPGVLPCAQLLVARRGETVHETVLGQRDIARGLPCESDTLFRIYSMTKPVTSVAFMTLVEEGRAALDDPVTRFVPEFADLGVYAGGDVAGFRTSAPKRPMQIIDLMRHTAGLTYGFQNATPVDAAYRALCVDPWSQDMAGFIGHLANLPLENSPGEAWIYSVATDVLGHIITQITGQPLDAVFQERILGPLGMGDTGFQVAPGEAGRFAACYGADPGGRLELSDDPTTSPFLAPPPMQSGGGGLISTAADYMRFANMLCNGGELEGARILAPATVRLMTANHLPGGGDLTELSRSLFSESTNAGVGFGLGFAVAFEPHRTLLPSSPGEFYWGGMASTGFWVDPVEEVTAVFMTQRMPSSSTQVRREMRTLVYQALVESNR